MQIDVTQSGSQVGSPPIPCRHLRCKEMSYQGQADDDFASGIYWCVRTQENTGPDGQSCSKCECGAERACYQS
jgi:hypothetical protein